MLIESNKWNRLNIRSTTKIKWLLVVKFIQASGQFPYSQALQSSDLWDAFDWYNSSGTFYLVNLILKNYSTNLQPNFFETRSAFS